MARAAPDKRSRLQRERERDISEQIALGLPAKSIPNTGEAQFDQRLFNTSKGMDSGYGHDDEYNVYDKPWKDGNSIASHIYRPSKNIDKDTYGDDLEKLVKTNRWEHTSAIVYSILRMNLIREYARYTHYTGF